MIKINWKILFYPKNIRVKLIASDLMRNAVFNIYFKVFYSLSALM